MSKRWCVKKMCALFFDPREVAKGRFITNSARRETNGPVVVRKRKKKISRSLHRHASSSSSSSLSRSLGFFFLPGYGLASSLKAKKKTFPREKRERRRKRHISPSLSSLVPRALNATRLHSIKKKEARERLEREREDKDVRLLLLFRE